MLREGFFFVVYEVVDSKALPFFSFLLPFLFFTTTFFE